MIIDTHAHYDDARFDGLRESLLPQLHQNGVELMVNAGACMSTSRGGAALAEAYDYIYFAAGVHPSEVASLTSADMDELARLLQHPKAVALGEIGLDYHYPEPSKEIQRQWFEAQLDVAVQTGKPVIIHDREAHQDCLDILLPRLSSINKVVFHCFSGEWEMARLLCDKGVYLGFGGVVTFKNARKSLDVVAQMPMELLLLETDCPYLAPEPYRGKLNHSGLLPYVVEKIAQARGMESGEVEQITSQNARRFFDFQG